VILLDTHAAIWIARRHRRAAALKRYPRLYLSPVSILEVQFLLETGRLQGAMPDAVTALAADPRWFVDEPPAERWFLAACEFVWTRDPFDRLLAAHARVRGWKLATADEQLLDSLPASDVIAL
jgi:PIN domain nuclease of toxin-antitoxin system